VTRRASISRRAEIDLAEQHRWYSEKAGIDVAERFLKEFDHTIRLLERQPGLGRARKFRARELSGVRSFPIVGRFAVHLIFYRDFGDALSVERVFTDREICPGACSTAGDFEHLTRRRLLPRLPAHFYEDIDMRPHLSKRDRAFSAAPRIRC
jgi:plasmid stabilization system protein ParE